MSTEEILIAKSKQGDLAAYGQLVERYQNRVYNLALKLIGSSEDAKDTVQEIFIKAYRALPGFQGEAGFSTWLYRVASNKCLDFLRKKNRERKHNYSFEEGDFSQEAVNSQYGPEEAFLLKEKQERLKKAVTELPETYRLVLVLHHYQGFSYREVAGITGLPEKTVATRLHRAKKLLREKLLGADVGELSKSKKGTDQVLDRGMSIL